MTTTPTAATSHAYACANADRQSVGNLTRTVRQTNYQKRVIDMTNGSNSAPIDVNAAAAKVSADAAATVAAAAAETTASKRLADATTLAAIIAAADSFPGYVTALAKYNDQRGVRAERINRAVKRLTLTDAERVIVAALKAERIAAMRAALAAAEAE